MKHLTFWFDVVSPYAYLAFERLPQAMEGLSYSVDYKPVVFGALLKHGGQKGPAEIEPKRQWTFRQVHWLAVPQRRRELLQQRLHRCRLLIHGEEACKRRREQQERRRQGRGGGWGWAAHSGADTNSPFARTMSRLKSNRSA